MKHLGTQIIETERLLLRKFQLSDAHAMYVNWASNPQVTRFLRKTPIASEKEALQYLENTIPKYNENSYYLWAMELKEKKQAIGVMALNRRGFEIDCRYEIGCYLGEAFWRNGFSTEATGAVIRFGFEKLQLKRIEAICAMDNIGAVAPLIASGLICEGLCRNLYANEDGTYDCNFYAITDTDYFAGKCQQK